MVCKLCRSRSVGNLTDLRQNVLAKEAPSPSPTLDTSVTESSAPSGVQPQRGHQCLNASEDFLVVGAYPPSGTYNECTSQERRKKALATIPRVARPHKDPVYGKDGPLMRIWRKPNRGHS